MWREIWCGDSLALVTRLSSGAIFLFDADGHDRDVIFAAGFECERDECVAGFGEIGGIGDGLSDELFADDIAESI